jgi:hypothetical protein
MTLTLAAARYELAGKIAAEGYRVTDDPRNINPPCVLIAPVNSIDRFTMCAFTADVVVWTLAPPPGNADAMDWALDSCQTLMELTGARNGTLGRYQVAGQELPGYSFTVQITS